MEFGSGGVKLPNRIMEFGSGGRMTRERSYAFAQRWANSPMVGFGSEARVNEMLDGVGCW